MSNTMLNISKYLAISLTLALVPLVSHAQTFATLVSDILSVVNVLVPLIIALTFLVIMWGVVKNWIIGNEDTNNIEKGKQTLIWGIVVLVIMLSIWGILNLLHSTFFG